jgi:hypothetical protein
MGDEGIRNCEVLVSVRQALVNTLTVNGSFTEGSILVQASRARFRRFHLFGPHLQLMSSV